ncbi:hypothetical protein [Paenibacillus illinoisensis]|uniref:Uncharacterized protein n=1 Tax=Paenibacillus illinoisensis TaxID=59845 RepID=A0A2W0C6A7_9BACL|nr:hypothetical protein [Paenibacillus illinoisensis]PYY28253.1 hypothetical protein PIL02S_03399 [Paenibacillus illinoisensis]
MNSYYELEKAKIIFKKIFNEDAENHAFPSTRYLKIVNQYGLITGVIQKAIELTDLHLKLQSDNARCGVYIDDDTFIELIRSNYNS